MARLRLTLIFATLLSVSCIASAQDAPDITFLSGDAARVAIVDESVEPYFSLLCHHEMEVKSGIAIEGDTLEEQQAFFAQHYADCVRDFTDEEEEALSTIVGLTDSLVKFDYPGFAAQPWSFIKVTSGVERGLPHTRGRSIVLAEGVLDFIVNARSDDRDAMHRMVMAKVELMLHEQMHVVQRLNPEPFAAFYTEHWGLVHVETIEYGDELTAMQLINPDGVDTRWVRYVGTPRDARYLQPNIVIERFENRPSRMPHDFRQVAVELRLDDDGVWRPVIDAEGQPVYTPLHDEPGYTAHYSPSGNIYHPHESFADLFAKMVLNDFGSYPEPGFTDDGAGQAQAAAFRAAVAPVRAMMHAVFGEAQGEGAEGE
ncbi:hypothetical protein OT109_06075 [Phycisphaeraceae bacterium D3-23]